VPPFRRTPLSERPTSLSGDPAYRALRWADTPRAGVPYPYDILQSSTLVVDDIMVPEVQFRVKRDGQEMWLSQAGPHARFGPLFTLACAQIVYEMTLPPSLSIGTPYQIAIALNGISYVFPSLTTTGYNTMTPTLLVYSPDELLVGSVFPPVAPAAGSGPFSISGATLPEAAVVVARFTSQLPGATVPSTLPAEYQSQLPFVTMVICDASTTQALCVTEWFPAGLAMLQLSVDGGRTFPISLRSFTFSFFVTPVLRTVTPSSGFSYGIAVRKHLKQAHAHPGARPRRWPGHHHQRREHLRTAERNPR
jgi:hypothetical protein